MTDVPLLDVFVRVIEIAPPSVAVQFVNVVGEVDVPPTLSVFPALSVAEMSAPPADAREK